MRVLPSLAVALVLTTAGCAAGGAGAHPADPAALPAQIATAAGAHQPLVLEFGAPWCAPCRAFAATVLVDPRVVAALRTVTFVQYDIETPAGADAARRCGIEGVPAVVALDATGAVRLRRPSREPTVDELLAFLQEASTPPR